MNLPATLNDPFNFLQPFRCFFATHIFVLFLLYFSFFLCLLFFYSIVFVVMLLSDTLIGHFNKCLYNLFAFLLYTDEGQLISLPPPPPPPHFCPSHFLAIDLKSSRSFQRYNCHAFLFFWYFYICFILFFFFVFDLILLIFLFVIISLSILFILCSDRVVAHLLFAKFRQFCFFLLRIFFFVFFES